MTVSKLPRRKSFSRTRPSVRSRRGAHSRRVIGHKGAVHVVPSKKVSVAGAGVQRRAYFDLAAPKIVLNPWKTKRDWGASRPKFLAFLLLAVLGFALYQ